MPWFNSTTWSILSHFLMYHVCTHCHHPHPESSWGISSGYVVSPVPLPSALKCTAIVYEYLNQLLIWISSIQNAHHCKEKKGFGLIWKYHRKTHRAAAVHNNPVGYIATILLPLACCKKFKNKTKKKTNNVFVSSKAQHGRKEAVRRQVRKGVHVRTISNF